MRVLLFGGRTYADGPYVFRVLDTFGPRVIIEGGARGADNLARAWAQHRGVPVETYRADWDTHPRAAGIIRNAEMLRDGRPDYGIGFPGGRGTADMARRIVAAGLPLIRLY